MKKLQKFLLVTLITLNALAALFLTVSYAAPYINPADFWPIAVFGLIYPLLLAINLLFTVIWLIRWRWYALISGIVLIIGMPLMLKFFRFKIPSPPYEGKRDFSVMSFNVNLFRLYSWSKLPPTMDSVAEMARRLHADILCLQEFFTNDSDFTEGDAKIIFGDTAHIHYIASAGKSGFGIATFSKFPIVASGEIHFEESANASIFTDLLIGGDTIRVYNTHLQSFRLKRRNLEFIKNPVSSGKGKTLHELFDLSTQIREAVERRAVQVLQVREHMDRSPYPVVVCGDFNDSPTSFTYRRMRGALLDAFQEAGDGFGSTYKAIFPSFRIDYIMHSPSVSALDYCVVPCDYSDHNPIFVPFSIACDEK